VDAVGKRQKKEEPTLESIDLEALPDGFRGNIVAADEPLALTQGVRSVEALVYKHHQAMVFYRRVLAEHAMSQSKLEARLKAMETAVPAVAKQHADEAKNIVSQATASAEVTSQRVGALTGQLDEYAQAMEASEKNQQEVLTKHLQTIEATFVKCDEVLTDVRASVATAGAAGPSASGGVLATPQQDLATLRGHIDGLAAAIQATSAQAKDAEDAVVLSRVQINELTAWCNNSDHRNGANVKSTDEKLREELKGEFRLVRGKFETLEAGLCKCPQGCPGRAAEASQAQASQGPERFMLTPGSHVESSPAKLPFLNRGRWASAGGGGGGGGGDDGDGGGNGDDGDDFDDYDPYGGGHRSRSGASLLN
jgi:hypothetical protein